MKNNIRKWLKKPGSVMILWCVLGAMLIGTGVYAAYVNFNSVKRVVSTGERDQVLFSSNYLYPVNQDETSYSLRRISPSSVQNTEGSEVVNGYTFTVQICNYAYGNQFTVNPNTIVYDFVAAVTMADGSALKPAVTQNCYFQEQDKLSDVVPRIYFVKKEENATVGEAILETRELTGGSPQKHNYTFFVPADLKDEIKIQVVARPQTSCYAYTNNQKLAVVVTMAKLSATNSWTGKFSDEQSVAPSAYDGWNYEISGNGKGTITLTWDTEVLQISPWFLQDVEMNSINTGSCSFSVGADNQPDAYQLQFYKIRESSGEGEDWFTFSQHVTVSFESEGQQN